MGLSVVLKIHVPHPNTGGEGGDFLLVTPGMLPRKAAHHLEQLFYSL